MNTESIINDLENYFSTYDPLSMQGWGYLLAVLGVFWLLSKVITFFLRRNQPVQQDDQPSTQQLIYRSQVRAYTILTILLFVSYCIFWRTGYYRAHPWQLVHLLSFLMIGAALITTLWQWSKLISAQGLKDLSGVPYTRTEEDKKRLSLVRSFKAAKIWVLAPLFAFIILLFIEKKSANLISIVIDTSTSMGVPNESGEIPLENGKRAMAKTLAEIQKTNDLVITIFSAGSSFKATATEILAIRNENNLAGINTFFSGADRSSAINYIYSVAENSEYSPIHEVIWKNFLFVQKQTQETKIYDKVIAIIITDGIELPEVDNDRFFCSNEEYTTIFSEPGDVHIINLLGDNTISSFFAKAADCGYVVQDGFTADTYSDSLETILEDYTSNWSFLFWMSGLIVLITLISLLVNPNYNNI
jgi:hypothetical protein